MQQSASRALVPTVIGDLLRTVPVWQLLAVVPLAEGALHGLVVSLEGALHGHASEKMERHDRVCFEIAGLTMIFHGVALDRHPRLVEPVLKALGPDSPTPAQLNLDSPLHGLEEGKLEHGLVSKESGQWHQVEVHELELAQLLCCELVSTLASVHLKSLSSMMVLLMVA